MSAKSWGMNWGMSCISKSRTAYITGNNGVPNWWTTFEDGSGPETTKAMSVNTLA